MQLGKSWLGKAGSRSRSTLREEEGRERIARVFVKEHVLIGLARSEIDKNRI